ncbi:putative integral membrane protein [Fusarium sporotrichioides]|uniref:Putative integral membrane protein n=1 Tax=Fusarium sporotrichioides TaxID=5514 RepID=A0A395RS50_FUSSP|nr:putative integral membrane protein [Fusarium sporotrichioides]
MSVENGVLYPMDPPPGMVRDIDQDAQSAPLVVIAAVFFPLATVCNVFLVAFTLNMTNYGMGKHLWNVPFSPDLFPNFSLNNLLAAIFFCAATGFAKGSILIFYLRIFPMRSARILIWTAFAFIIGYSTASVLVNIFSCNPIRGSWDPEVIATAKCINRPVFYFLQAGLGIFADILTVLIPLPWLKTLMLPKKQKIGVGVLLTMGASVLLHDPDLTYNTVMALMWCVLELNLSIIGGSVATIKPFLRIAIPRMFTTNYGASASAGIHLESKDRSTGYLSRSAQSLRPHHSAKTPQTSHFHATSTEELVTA